MAIGDHGMLAVDTSVLGAAKAALEAMLNEDSELVTIYYGSDVTEADAEASESRPKRNSRIRKSNCSTAVSYLLLYDICRVEMKGEKQV